MARRRSRWPWIALMVAATAGPGAWWLARTRPSPGPIESAERALGAGDLAGAGSILARILADDPGQARARLLYARLLRLSGRVREADIALGRAMDSGAPEPEVWREYGLLIAASDFAKAEPILRARSLGPGDLEVSRALAEGLARQGRWAESIGPYSRWLAAEPGRAEASIGRARALVLSGRSSEAVPDLRAALGLRPSDYQARLLLADCLIASGESAAAVVELEKCRRLRPDRPEPLVGQARLALEADDPDRAFETLDRAIALDPSSVVALAARGSLAAQFGRDDLALADFGRVVELEPGHKQGHFQLAALLRKAGDPGRAAEHERAFRGPGRDAPVDAEAGQGPR